VRRFSAVLSLAALVSGLSVASHAQSASGGQFPGVTQAQVEQLLGGQGRGQAPMGQTPMVQPETTILEPTANPVQTLQPSRLEQIFSARAGVALSLFGYDQLGVGRPVTLPQMGGVQDSYILGPGDETIVTLRGQENSEYRVIVDRDGRVALPRLNPIEAAGRSLGEFREQVAEAVRRAFPSTQSYVTIGRLREISVLVAGEVGSPGVRTLTGLSTPLDAVLVSGGIKKTGSLRDVRLIRQGRSIPIDFYSVLATGGSSRAITLADGDHIFVPPLTKVVAAAGWFRRPAIYELPAGQSAISARTLESLAGGVEVGGRYRLEFTHIERNGQTRLTTVTAPSNLVHDGEVLLALPGADQTVGKAVLSGGTALAGGYAVRQGMRLSEVLKAPGALGPSPYTIFGIISRRDPRTLLRTLIAFSPVQILTGSEDPPLLEDDIVRVFSMNEAKLLSRAIKQDERIRQHNEEAVRNPYLASLDQRQTTESGTLSSYPMGMQANQTSPLQATGQATNQDNSGQTIQQPPDDQSAISTSETAPSTGLQQQYPQQYAAPSSATAGATQAALAARTSSEPGQELNGMAQQPLQVSNGSMPLNTPEGTVPTLQSNQQPAPAANFEREVAPTGTVPQNMTATALGDIASQLRIETPILVSFLEDHEVTLDGAVRAPSIYVVGPGVNLHDLVMVAGGTDHWADESGVELITTSVDKVSGSAATVRKMLALNDSTLSNYEIRAHDELRFRQVFNDIGLGSVTLEGEVRFPGEYRIVRGERLADLLKRAGGLTDTAYPFGTVYLRRSAAALEEESFRRTADQIESQLLLAMSRNSAAPKLDPAAFTVTQGFIRTLKTQKGLGRVSIVADPAILAAQPEQNTLLEGGDVIYVPQRPSTVSVLGEVLQPGSFVYKSSLSPEDYLAKAGGATAYADESLTFIVLPDGSAVKLDRPWLPYGSQSVPTGSTIVVPRDIAPLQWSDVVSNATQIFSQLAVAGASLAVISSNLK
jgi:protein involved in polysaccharide export with SLBB domain